MWLAIHFTQLPIEVFNTNIVEQKKPRAIIQNNQIICKNQSASQFGIKLNQSISTALALCGEIQFYERNLSLEKQQLVNLALMVYRYSPSICIENDRFLLVEIGRSLKLFSCMAKLLQQLQQDLDKEKFSYQIGIGNTPKCSELLSYQALDKTLLCWQSELQTFDKIQLQQQLSNIPINFLNIPINIIKKLQSTGIRSLGELRKLPNKAITKRFGKTFSQYLLQLYGELADPKVYFVPEENFSQKVEFIDLVHSQQGLVFSIKRLVKDLCRFLVIKQKSSHCLHWQLFDSDKNTIQFNVLLANGMIRESSYFELTQLSLERHKLNAPIEAISLTVNQLNELLVKTGSLIEDTQEFKNDVHFINQIRAKLGNKSCTIIQERSEHIPELASQQKTNSTSKLIPNLKKSESKKILSDRNTNPNHQLTHPTWLLENPEPIKRSKNRLSWHGELKIISQKERITLNWWNKKIIRDYFLAEHDNGVIYWIYNEPINNQYFIHGIYS